MKLKLVVASMSILGLISFPTFAAHHHHHKHHHKKIVKHEEEVAPEPVAKQEYKETIALPTQPITEVCSVSKRTVIMELSTQNLGRALPNPCNPGWFNRIFLSGGANVDFGKWGNRNANFEGENYRRFSLNDVYLNVSANINEWANGFISLSYSNTSNENRGGFESWTSSYSGFSWMDKWNFRYSDVYQDNKLSLEQAYATIGNFNVTPFYLQLGKEFTDFSRYEIHPITRSFTQVLSESLQTQARLGFILPNGLNGSIYAFDNHMSQFESSENVGSMNYGIGIGYSHPNELFGWNVGGGYLYNMIGANDVGHAVKMFNDDGFHNRVSAVALYGDVNSGPFTLNARWTGATQRFNVMDLPKNGWAAFTPSWTIMPDASGAEPWAYTLQGGYGYALWNRNQDIVIGWQGSGEAAGIGLPQNRFLLGWNMELAKYAYLGLEWDHDKAYSTSHGGTGGSDNLITIRTSVKFN